MMNNQIFIARIFEVELERLSSLYAVIGLAGYEQLISGTFNLTTKYGKLEEPL